MGKAISDIYDFMGLCLEDPGDHTQIEYIQPVTGATLLYGFHVIFNANGSESRTATFTIDSSFLENGTDTELQQKAAKIRSAVQQAKATTKASRS